MAQLAALFDFNLEGFQGACLAEGSNLSVACRLSATQFEVELRLSMTAGFGSGDSDVKRYVLGHVNATVSRVVDDFNVDEPSAIANSMQRRYDAQTAVLLALNRVLDFFRYQLRNPIPRELRRWDVHDQPGFYCPLWTLDGAAITYGPGREWGPGAVSMGQGSGFIDLKGFGITKLFDGDVSVLQKYLDEGRKPRLFDELLSNAQSAFFDQKIPRATLELALAAEVLVKTSFFGGSPVAYAALETLRSVQVTELLTLGALRAFGVSFAEDRSKDHANILRLFEARNSVAHRGVAQYWAKGAKAAARVTAEDLKNWWDSVLELDGWLGIKVAAAPSS